MEEGPEEEGAGADDLETGKEKFEIGKSTAKARLKSRFIAQRARDGAEYLAMLGMTDLASSFGLRNGAIKPGSLHCACRHVR